MAAAGGWFHDVTFLASTSASMATGQFTFVCPSTATVSGGRYSIQLCVSTTNGGGAGGMGILQDAPLAGRAGDVRVAGISKVVATTSASITLGGWLTPNGSGQAMVADTTGQLVLARALSASTGLVAGSLVDALLVGPFTWFA